MRANDARCVNRRVRNGASCSGVSEPDRPDRPQRDGRPTAPDGVLASARMSVSHALSLMLWVSTAVAVQAPAPRSSATAEEAELTRLEQAWNTAHLRGDAAALEKMSSDDLTVTVPGMPVFGKAEAFGVLRSGRMTFSRYETSETRMRVYGDSAIISGRLRRTRAIGGRTVDDDWRFTKVYVRRAGVWQVVAWHGSESDRP